MNNKNKKNFSQSLMKLPDKTCLARCKNQPIYKDLVYSIEKKREMDRARKEAT